MRYKVNPDFQVWVEVQVKTSALLMQYALVQISGTALLIVAGINGWARQALAADQTNLVIVIAAVFLIGWLISTYNAIIINHELNDGLTPHSDLAMKQRISWVQYISNTLILLGLIGTVAGFIIALSGVDPDKASDVDSISPMVSTLIAGMSTALYTTLVGSVLSLWLTLNYQVLAAGTVRLLREGKVSATMTLSDDDLDRIVDRINEGGDENRWTGLGGK